MNMKLIVRSPTQKYSDQAFDISSTWSVHQLKSFLSTEYPSKPPVKGQRLIYSGRLLENDQNLSQVFETSSEIGSKVIIHLVCTQETNAPVKGANEKASPQSPASDNSNTSANTRGSHNDSHSETNLVNNSINNTSQVNENTTQSQAAAAAALTTSMFTQMGMNSSAFMPQFFNPYMNPFMVNPYTALLAPYLPTHVTGQLSNVNASSEETMALQQLYSRLLSSHSFASPLTPFSNANLSNGLIGHLTNGTGQMVYQQQQEQQNRPQVNEDAYDDGEDDDDDGDNQDWLDIVYWIPRVLVLLSIVYFYSSFTRLIWIFGFAVCLYLYRVGMTFARPLVDINRPIVLQDQPGQVDGEAQPIEPLDRVNQQRNDAPLVADGVRARRSVAPSASSNSASSSSPVTSGERWPNLRVVWIVISSLFTSLIPEQYPLDLH